MPLVKRLPATGNWLFRWRSFLPISVVFGAILAMYPFPIPKRDAPISDWIEVASLGISFLGMLVRALTVGHTPAGTSGRNTATQIAESLNTTGIYSTVRHPLYLANFLVGLGLACFTLSWWFVVVYILTFWLYYERIMMAEEAFLQSKFGELFDQWAERTPPFIPSFRHYTRTELSFSLLNVLRREYNTLFQIVVVAFLLELFGDLFETRRVQVSANWWIFLGVGSGIWFVLRALKRNTTLLNVKGR